MEELNSGSRNKKRAGNLPNIRDTCGITVRGYCRNEYRCDCWVKSETHYYCLQRERRSGGRYEQLQKGVCIPAPELHSNSPLRSTFYRRLTSETSRRRRCEFSAHVNLLSGTIEHTWTSFPCRQWFLICYNIKDWRKNIIRWEEGGFDWGNTNEAILPFGWLDILKTLFYMNSTI